MIPVVPLPEKPENKYLLLQCGLGFHNEKLQTSGLEKDFLNCGFMCKPLKGIKTTLLNHPLLSGPTPKHPHALLGQERVESASLGTSGTQKWNTCQNSLQKQQHILRAYI